MLRLLPRLPLNLTATATTASASFKFYSTAIPSTLESNLRIALKASMKARDKFRTEVVKSILSDIGNSSHLASPPSPLKTLARAITIRTDAATTFSTSGRTDLAKQYLEEVEILKEFQESENSSNNQMSNEEIEKIIKSVLVELNLEKGIASKDVGTVIKTVLKQNNLLEGKLVSDLVKKFII